jgi:hypothetical protein
VHAIVLKGAGGRALCAGGDVRAIATAPLDSAQRAAAAVAYFRGEDALVYRIATLSKPHVAIMDGIVMVRRAPQRSGAAQRAHEADVFLIRAMPRSPRRAAARGCPSTARCASPRSARCLPCLRRAHGASSAAPPRSLRAGRAQP